jgi:(2Fe-2S) ferredoxin
VVYNTADARAGTQRRKGGRHGAMADNSKQHVLVCNNVDCLGRGGQKVFEALRDHVAAAGLADRVEVTQYPCFGGCDYGPNVVVFPAKAFYSGVKPTDVAEIAAHASGGPRVERLTGQVDPQVEELIFDLLDAGLL